MIAVGAFISIFFVCAILFFLLTWFYPLLSLVMNLAPNLMALVTLIVSIVEKFNRTKPYSSSTPGNLLT